MKEFKAIVICFRRMKEETSPLAKIISKSVELRKMRSVTKQFL